MTQQNSSRHANANLFQLFANRFPHDLSQPALETHEGLHYSWHDLLAASARIAHLLTSLKLPAGSRVAVQVEKSPEALMLYLATLRAGLVYLPLNPAYQKAEMAYFIANAEPAVVVCSPNHFGWVSRLAFKTGTAHVFTLGEDRTGTLLERAVRFADEFVTVISQPDDLAAILYTSGTTGRSKGAMLTHGNLAASAKVLNDYWAWRNGQTAQHEDERDVLLHALPLFHIHGLFVACHGALLSGSKMIFLPKLDVSAILHHLPRCTMLMGVPTYYTRLLADARFTRELCANIRLFVSGSAPLLLDTFKQFQVRTGHTILERYGMSETGMLTSNPYDSAEGPRVGGTVGKALPGVNLRVVNDQGQPCAVDEIGHVQVKGANVFVGYWQMPEKTREEFTDDGYFKTGDVGKLDAQAYLSIVGRSKDLIITGGYNVYPKEIERYIDDMPGVLESAVIGIPHPDFGEAVTAVVVPKPGGQVDESVIIAQLKQLIANYKVPKQVIVVDELPRNAMGKIQKNVLRQMYSPTTTGLQTA